MCKKHLIGIAACAVLSTGYFANAADPTFKDTQFIDTAAGGGMVEVQLGRYAVDHATSPDVKQFAQEMVDDHTKADDELKGIVGAAQIPSQLAQDEKDTIDRIEKLSGSEFDKAYAAQMVEDHKNAIAAFEKERDQGADPAIKDFAVKTLPTLRHHLEMAQDVNKKVNP